jgi:hypothetical protein
MKRNKIIGATLLCVIIVLIITNPSISKLNEYVGHYPTKYNEVIVTRTSNFLIFSKFHVSYLPTHIDDYSNNYSADAEKESEAQMQNISGDYYGFLFNFCKENNTTTASITPVIPKLDSTIRDTVGAASTKEYNLILKENDREKLDKIIQEMINNKEDDSTIKAVVNDFKSKYGFIQYTPYGLAVLKHK